MRKTLTGLAFLATALTPCTSKALLGVDGDPMYAHGTCEFHGYKLEVTCSGTLSKNACELYILNKKGKRSPLPKDIDYDIFVGWTNYGQILYCKDRSYKEKDFK